MQMQTVLSAQRISELPMSTVEVMLKQFRVEPTSVWRVMRPGESYNLYIEKLDIKPAVSPEDDRTFVSAYRYRDTVDPERIQLNDAARSSGTAVMYGGKEILSMLNNGEMVIMCLALKED